MNEIVQWDECSFFCCAKKGTKKRRCVEMNSFARYALSLKQLFDNKVLSPYPQRGIDPASPGLDWQVLLVYCKNV